MAVFGEEGGDFRLVLTGAGDRCVFQLDMVFVSVLALMPGVSLLSVSAVSLAMF